MGSSGPQELAVGTRQSRSCSARPPQGAFSLSSPQPPPTPSPASAAPAYFLTPLGSEPKGHLLGGATWGWGVKGPL